MNPGLNIKADLKNLEFIYGDDVAGPVTEKRRLDDIRKSLSDPDVDGPEVVYAVAMDVAKKKHLSDLKSRNLLYGAMIFGPGLIGQEPVRSQGHIHAVSMSCNASTCEVYEIWSGKACIYMQETAEDNPGNCYAVFAQEGDVVIVPPGWAHATINADPNQAMLFGAWCVRDYGFDYRGIRAHGGIAHFPVIEKGQLIFKKNPAYQSPELIIKSAREHSEFGIRKGISIYQQYEENPDLFKFVTNPETVQKIWEHYIP